MLSRALAACALSGALAACAQLRPRRPRRPTPGATAGATVTPALRAVQERLAAQDRLSDARLLASVRQVRERAAARDVTPRGSQVERLLVTVTNRGTRDLHGVDGRLQLYRGRDARRLGLAMFHAAVDVAPGRSARVPVAIPLTDFAEGAGPLAQEAGQPKLVELELIGVDFGRGERGGETD